MVHDGVKRFFIKYHFQTKIENGEYNGQSISFRHQLAMFIPNL